MPDLRFPKPNREMAECRRALASEAEGASHAFSGAVFAEGALGSSTKETGAVASVTLCIEGPVNAAWSASAAAVYSVKALDLMGSGTAG